MYECHVCVYVPCRQSQPSIGKISHTRVHTRKPLIWCLICMPGQSKIFLGVVTGVVLIICAMMLYNLFAVSSVNQKAKDLKI